MTERIKITLSVDEETNQKIKRLGELTHRNDSHVIDWLVAEAWERMQQVHVATTTIAEAEAQEPA